MDPKANIKEQAELARMILRIQDQCSYEGDLTAEQKSVVAELALRLAELVSALDEHRRKGGFDPYVRP